MGVFLCEREAYYGGVFVFVFLGSCWGGVTSSQFFIAVAVDSRHQKSGGGGGELEIHGEGRGGIGVYVSFCISCCPDAEPGHY